MYCWSEPVILVLLCVNVDVYLQAERRFRRFRSSVLFWASWRKTEGDVCRAVIQSYHNDTKSRLCDFCDFCCRPRSPSNECWMCWFRCMYGMVILWGGRVRVVKAWSWEWLCNILGDAFRGMLLSLACWWPLTPQIIMGGGTRERRSN